MKQVANMLGVEVGEVFQVDDVALKDCNFRFTNDDLEFFVEEDTGWKSALSCTLNRLLKGKLNIKKSHWKPKKGDLYYMPHISGSNITFSWNYWNNRQNEKKAYKLGLICKTRREVNRLTKRMLTVAKESREQ